MDVIDCVRDFLAGLDSGWIFNLGEGTVEVDVKVKGSLCLLGSVGRICGRILLAITARSFNLTFAAAFEAGDNREACLDNNASDLPGKPKNFLPGTGNKATI